MNIKWIILIIVVISSFIISLTVGLSASGYFEQTTQPFAEIKDVKLERNNNMFFESLYLYANITMNEDGGISKIIGDAHMKNGNTVNIDFLGGIGEGRKGQTYSLSTSSMQLSKDELDQLDHIKLTVVPSNSSLGNITLAIKIDS